MYNAGFGGGFLRRMTRLAASASTRLESTGSPPLVCPLPSRSALSLRGSEASALLQGLVTNDLRHLDDRLPGAQDLALQQEPVAAPGVKQASDRRAIYALFLNTAGRVLFDALVFSDREDPDRLVLDCHKDVAEKVAKHLKMYKLRRKVDIEVVQGAKAVAVLNNSDGGNKEKLRVRLSQGAVFSVDPRLPALGHRFVLPPASGEDNPFGPGFSQGSESDYDSLRHQLGVSEGPHEMPPGKCFPLEYNADYLHGVSFHKGCYIGQELTARYSKFPFLHIAIQNFKLIVSESTTRALFARGSCPSHWTARQIAISTQTLSTRRAGGWASLGGCGGGRRWG